jgi:hypothetical protein
VDGTRFSDVRMLFLNAINKLSIHTRSKEECTVKNNKDKKSSKNSNSSLFFLGSRPLAARSWGCRRTLKVLLLDVSTGGRLQATHE